MSGPAGPVGGRAASCVLASVVIAAVWCMPGDASAARRVEGTAVGSSGNVGRDAEILDRLGEDLQSEDPFTWERARAELQRRGTGALPVVVGLLRDPRREVRFRADALLAEILESFLLDLDREVRSLALDRRELSLLEAKKDAGAEILRLKETMDQWRKEFSDLDEAVRRFVEWSLLRDQLEEASDTPSAEETARLERLGEDVSRFEAAIPGLAEKAKSIGRFAVLEVTTGGATELREVEALRLEDLAERVEERAPRVSSLVEVLAEVGAPAYAALAAHLEFLPLLDATALRTRRSDVLERYEKILADASARLDSEGKLFPPEAELELDRYHLGPLWAMEIDRNGPTRERAADFLRRHLELTVRDLSATNHLVAERAAKELFRLKKRGLEALNDTTGTPRQDFLRGLLMYRVDPAAYRIHGIHLNDYEHLSFAARRRRIFQLTRTLGLRAIPTLRAICENDEIEPSLLVKYAAAKALATYLRDRSGFQTLQAKHPELVLSRPEISRDLILLEGLAYIRSKDYASAVREFAKILETLPFDFEGNYHIAFAYLLLKDYRRAIHHFEIARRIQPKDQLTLYNLACAYSLGGKLEEALESLQAAVDAGFRDADHMEKDADLGPVRDRPEYRKIVESARSRD